jgi:hypothetical protein
MVRRYWWLPGQYMLLVDKHKAMVRHYLWLPGQCMWLADKHKAMAHRYLWQRNPDRSVGMVQWM